MERRWRALGLIGRIYIGGRPWNIRDLYAVEFQHGASLPMTADAKNNTFPGKNHFPAAGNFSRIHRVS